MRRSFFKRLLLVLAVLVVGVSSAVPVQAIPDFYSDSNIQFYDPNACEPGGSGGGADLSGSENEEKIWNFLISKGLEPVQAAGIMGNLHEESTYNPDAQEDGKSPPKGGYGVAQWTGTGQPGDPAGDRRLKLINGLKSAGISVDMSKQLAKKPIDNDKLLGAQLEYMWEEATDRGDIEKLKTETTAEGAAQSWMDNFERATVRVQPARIAIAEGLVKNPPGGSSSSSSVNNGGSACQCQESSASSSTTIVLDPGHSGIDKQGKEKDTETGLFIGDSSNSPERQQAWDVAQKIKGKLDKKGYKVLLTKKNVDDYASLRDRVTVANNAKAALAVSIHNTSGTFGSSGSGWVTEQKVGGYRENESGKKTSFDDEAVAKKSLEYANKILDARKKEEGGVELHDINFTGRPGLSAGNLSMVQLLSKVPWVYNEVGQTGWDEGKYAKGIADGIIDAIPNSGAQGSPATSGACDTGSGGDVVSIAEREYKENKGIPEYEGDIKQYTTNREEAWCADFVSWVYKEANKPFTDGGEGGWQHPGVLELADWFKSKHTYFEVGTQKPQPGDVAFYIGSQTPDGGSAQHVNIVVAVNGESMTTIGGNEGDQIKKGPREIKLGANSLVGFGRLK